LDKRGIEASFPACSASEAWNVSGQSLGTNRVAGATCHHDRDVLALLLARGENQVMQGYQV
jgi:hypothetical protein